MTGNSLSCFICVNCLRARSAIWLLSFGNALASATHRSAFMLESGVCRFASSSSTPHASYEFRATPGFLWAAYVPRWVVDQTSYFQQGTRRDHHPSHRCPRACGRVRRGSCEAWRGAEALRALQSVPDAGERKGMVGSYMVVGAIASFARQTRGTSAVGLRCGKWSVVTWQVPARLSGVWFVRS